MTTRDTTPSEAVDVSSWDGVAIPERVRNRTSVAIAVGGSLSTYVPRRPGCYLRTSRDRQGDERSIGLQLDDAEAKRTALGWAPFTEMYRENDTSAFKKKRTVRADGSADWASSVPSSDACSATSCRGGSTGSSSTTPIGWPASQGTSKT
jgi:hypothetical protein